MPPLLQVMWVSRPRIPKKQLFKEKMPAVLRNGWMEKAFANPIYQSWLNTCLHKGKSMVTQKSLTAAAMSGVGLAILFALMNGVSTYILPDNQTLDQWVTTKVGAV